MTISARIEALLYASENPLSVVEMASILNEEHNIVRKELQKLIKKMSEETSGLYIAKIGNRYKLTVKKEYQDIVGPVSASELNRTDLKVAGIIATRERTIKGDLRRSLGDRYIPSIKTLKEKGQYLEWNIVSLRFSYSLLRIQSGKLLLWVKQP